MSELQRLPSERHEDLPKFTRDFLDELRPEEIEVMRSMVRLGPDGAKQLIETIRFAQSVMTVGKFMRWAIIGMLGIFFASVLLAEKIMQVFSWFTHGRPS